jgi:hypothetical protein
VKLVVLALIVAVGAFVVGYQLPTTELWAPGEVGPVSTCEVVPVEYGVTSLRCGGGR